MFDVAGLRESMGQFLAEIRRVNTQLAETNRKLDQAVELLKIQAEMGAAEPGTYTYPVPEGWHVAGFHAAPVEEGEDDPE